MLEGLQANGQVFRAATPPEFFCSFMAAVIVQARSAAIDEWYRRLAGPQRCAPWRSLTVWPLSILIPAALEDACSAWRFLRQAGIAAAHIAVGGDSAGGGLTAALIGRLKAAGEELPGCAWLVSPWVDLTMSGSTVTTKDAVDPLIHRAYLEELAVAYVPAGMDRMDPTVSPLFGDLRGFPPTLIQVGSAETLLADASRFAAAAGAADVSVRLDIWPHMIHAWHLWNARLEAGRRALGSAGEFIRACV